ncbi:heavy-metal-associated domain-containing protein [Ammoniphilus sp. YIM 78166]|uniref:heavy-metal-associated domain-containing protein n=1 Tax=Ammoniphilus sp. YIM 78166 TaxID=1644106 RepID=UPI001F0EEA0B|nr:heavy-metal-associated domain-containing protein [Ammoniphilus sp. YIM 78166]
MSKSWWLPILSALLLSACGNMPQAGVDQNQSQTMSDNRTEYLIQNRTETNEYMEPGTASNSRMDTRVYDERVRAGLSGQALQSAQYQVEQSIRDLVKGIPGVQDAEVDLLGTTVRIRVQAADGADRSKLEQKVQQQVRLLYNYNVQVVSY